MHFSILCIQFCHCCAKNHSYGSLKSKANRQIIETYKPYLIKKSLNTSKLSFDDVVHEIKYLLLNERIFKWLIAVLNFSFYPRPWELGFLKSPLISCLHHESDLPPKFQCSRSSGLGCVALDLKSDSQTRTFL